MKKIISALAIVISITACSDSKSDTDTKTDTTTTVPSAPGASNGSAQTNADNGGAYPTDSMPGNTSGKLVDSIAKAKDSVPK